MNTDQTTDELPWNQLVAYVEKAIACMPDTGPADSYVCRLVSDRLTGFLFPRRGERHLRDLSEAQLLAVVAATQHPARA